MSGGASGSGNQPSSEARRPFLERPVTLVTLVGGILGIAVALVTLWPSGDGPQDEKQAKVEACLTDHGLEDSIQRTEFAEGRVVFRGCQWPPPAGAAADGFTEITVASREGPGESEAEGMTVADVFTTECADIEAQYLFDNMGTFVPEEPVRLTKGEIRRVEGGSVWFPRDELEASIYTPRRDEFIVMSALRYRLDSVRCIE
jgi:hypothetical protein